MASGSVVVAESELAAVSGSASVVVWIVAYNYSTSQSLNCCSGP